MADKCAWGRGAFRGGQRGTPQGRGSLQGRGDMHNRGGVSGFQSRPSPLSCVSNDFNRRGGIGGGVQGRGRSGNSVQPLSTSRGRGWGIPTTVPAPVNPALEDFPTMPGTVEPASRATMPSPASSIATSVSEQHQQEGVGSKKKKKGKKAGAAAAIDDSGTSQVSSAAQSECAFGRSEGPPEQAKPAQQKKKKKKGPQKELEVAMSSLALGNKLLPNRPDRGGCSGAKIRVGVNCWDFSIKDLAVLVYDIEPTKAFKVLNDGSEKDLNAQPKMLRELLQDVIKRLPKGTFYDGGRIIFSLDPLPGVSTSNVIRREPVNDPLEKDQLAIQYTIKEVSRVSATAILEYVNDPTATTRNIPQVAINMVDNLLRWVNRETFKNFGRSAMFYPTAKQPQPEKMFDIHDGFMVSVRPQWKVRMNIDMVHRAFFPTGNLADTLYAKYGEKLYDSHKWKEMVVKDIRMIRVEADYYRNEQGKKYKRRFTVQGLSDNSAETELIPDKNISIAQYFKDTYGIILKYPELPCVKTKKDKNEYIPLELLSALPYQNPTADKGEIASAVIRCAAVRPQNRFKELDKFVFDFMRNHHELLRRFELRMPNRQPVTVEARELPQPKGQFRGQQPALLGRGKWNPAAYFEPARGTLKWAVCAVPPHKFSTDNLEKVKCHLPSAATKAGVNLSSQPIDFGSRVAANLGDVFDECVSRGVNVIVFVLNGTLDYPKIKRLGDLQKGIVTQCVKAGNLMKPNLYANLMLKINGKLGGMNWLVSDLKPSDELIMVMGADVTHPSPTGSHEMQKSVAAVIGSITPDLMKYAAIVRQQDTTASTKDKATREVIDSMDGMFFDLLNTFRTRNNGRLPSKIIFYRDGVSEGQFETVLQSELCDMQRACRKIQGNYEPGITFIVVQKRHHIRFSPSDPRMRNVNPGTVVDSLITHPREFDFYLCSQDGIQGTSKPAHYHVLYDDNNWSSDALQRFTYFLCHAYMRCCRTVSYPAPTFYSHLAAFRARDWLKGAERPGDLLDNNRFRINSAQSTRMFFL